MSQRQALLGVLIALLVTAGGLSWAKWLPYTERAGALAASGAWKGKSLLAAATGDNASSPRSSWCPSTWSSCSWSAWSAPHRAASSGRGGALAILVAALIGTLLVLTTGGEIPILLGLAAAGASAGVLGARLIVLPAVSLPSAVMVGRALGWRATAATAGATVVAGLVAGGLLSALA